MEHPDREGKRLVAAGGIIGASLIRYCRAPILVLQEFMRSAPINVNLLAIARTKIEGNPASSEVLLGIFDLLAESATNNLDVHLMKLTISGYGGQPA